MKKQLLLKHALTAIVSFIAVGLFAQDLIVLDPKDMIPADTGYYIGGVYKDNNDDGVDEFYNGCVDEYGDANHNESGIQFGFTYNRCMIMPDCWPKDAVDDHEMAEIDHAEGYIELTKTKYINTDSAVLGYIICPPVENLVSMTLETSPDVTPQESRHIYFWIEYSKDRGETWEAAYIEDETLSKKGDSRTYDGSVFPAFQDMITASQEGEIVLRIFNAPQEQSQRLKVHYIEIVADKVNAISEISVDEPGYRVYDGVIYGEQGSISVYSILGQFMGEGNSVAVKQGIYLVRTKDGKIRKVFVQ